MAGFPPSARSELFTMTQGSGAGQFCHTSNIVLDRVQRISTLTHELQEQIEYTDGMDLCPVHDSGSIFLQRTRLQVVEPITDLASDLDH